MADIRKLPPQDNRVETGVVQFGEDDWPGLFVRGDDCLALWLALDGVSDEAARMNVMHIIRAIKDGVMGDSGEVTKADLEWAEAIIDEIEAVEND